ncbi:toxin-antitoxin system TumE family protein [Haloquadratum walsbyi]|uniref:toxin-antitoxin system TumE family protein n=1 Tax=Haloquadratum walsbyi TaxID=293091 RepID=UPI0006776361|nr:DUF6516 family protein [Haloquadratum walsbyi]
MGGYPTDEGWATNSRTATPHVEAGLVENLVIRRTTDTDAYPSGWKYTLHLGTLQDLTLIRYDNAHEDTKGHELHTASGDADVEFWASADEYWDTIGGNPQRPY